jgi:hypothetical protein
MFGRRKIYSIDFWAFLSLEKKSQKVVIHSIKLYSKILNLFSIHNLLTEQAILEKCFLSKTSLQLYNFVALPVQICQQMPTLLQVLFNLATQQIKVWATTILAREKVNKKI